jgi:high affinity Mn2+ porin
MIPARWCLRLLLALLLLLQDGAALAADPTQAGAFDWTGVYLGAHAGYAFGNGETTLTDADATRTKGTLSSLVGGLQGGYRRRISPGLVLGLETGVTFPNFYPGDDAEALFQSSTRSYALTLDAFGEARGSVGYALGRLLLFGAGGFAWSLQHLSETPGVASSEDDAWQLAPGWTAAVGAELQLTPAWTVRLEGFHDQFAKSAGLLPSGISGSAALGVSGVLAALNWRIHWPGERAAEAPVASAQPQQAEQWNVHAQSTFIEQGYPSFHSPYQGANSLQGAAQAADTASYTVYFGTRLWNGAELYLDPEVMQGFGLSQTFGAAAFPNGEAQKAGFLVPRSNIARIFVTQTFGFGGERETVEDAPNQLAGDRDVSRLSITVGKLATTDWFIVNAYANDSRNNFLNWNIDWGGSYDWTMDQISYTWGALVELNQKAFAVRAGYFLMPVVSNSNTMDLDIPNHGEYAAELELRYWPFSRPGKLRLFGWLNRGNMGSYASALAEPVATPGYPDITLTRETRDNYGFVIGLEQELSDDLGLFSRLSWSPGQLEIMGWTDCDESASFGASLKGTRWGRPRDTVGLAGVIEGLSAEAIAYFTAGGLGILIGDGKMSYQPEAVTEVYYSYRPWRWLAVTLDYQFMVDPGYNADRGPVSFFTIRLHADF